MFSLLKKIFIKDYNNIKEESVRTKYGVLASVFSVIINLFLFIIKLIIGILSNSISIIGDAINNLTDMGSSIISFIGFKLSSKPADKDHPYGHQRIEYITSFIISVIIIVVGSQLFISSINKIISKEVSNYSYVTLIVLFISILIKLYLSYFNKSVGETINSLPLIASSKDALNDVIATSILLISAIVSIVFKVNIDGIMGVLVSLFIMYSGYDLVKETISILIGEKVEPELIKEVLNEIKKYEDVLGIHDVMCHSYGPTKIYMSLHAEVDCSKNILDIHTTIDEIENTVKNNYNIDLVIHMDPIDLECEVTGEYKEKVKNILQNISPLLSFHDFRAVVTTSYINLIFDVVVPFNFEISNNDIKKLINNELFNNQININLIISFDDDLNT